MSVISFYSPQKTAEVAGSELAYCRYLCKKLTMAVLRVASDDDQSHPIRQMLPQDHPLQSVEERYFLRQLEAIIGEDAETTLTINGQRETLMSIKFNTALVIGDDLIKLVARLAGQVELHCFVEGSDRRWLARLLEEALQTKILRRGAGWESVVALLRQSNTDPIVASSSVTNVFPNHQVAIQGNSWSPPTGSTNDDAVIAVWDTLTDSEQWQLAMEGLRNLNRRRRIELRPTEWGIFRFGAGFSAFDIING